MVVNDCASSGHIVTDARMHCRPRSFRALLPAGYILPRRPALEQGGAQLTRAWVKARPSPAYALRIGHGKRPSRGSPASAAAPIAGHVRGR